MSKIEFSGRVPEYTIIPDGIILRHFRKSSGNEIKVLISLMMMEQKNSSPSMEEISEVTGLSDLDIISACDSLSSKGIIRLESMDNSGNMTINLDPLKKKEVLKKAPPSDGNENFKNLVSDCERITGAPLSPQLLGFLGDLKDFYAFPDDLIIYLFSYSRERNAANKFYMEKTASNWKNEGLDSLEAVLQYHTSNRETYRKYRDFLKYAGIKSGTISKTHMDFLNRWMQEYGFSQDMIYRACDISVSSTGRADLNYMDSVLRNWKEAGIKTPSDAEKSKSLPRDSRKVAGFTGYSQRENTDYDNIIMGWDPDEK